MLDRFLEGSMRLKEVRSNRILLATNPPLKNEIVNAASAARATVGADVKVLVLDRPLVMEATVGCDGATGKIIGFEQFLRQIQSHSRDFDVLVVSSQIETDDEKVKTYLEREGGVNIWGGVEAMFSKKASSALGKPVFHAPVENSKFFKTYNEIVDPRKSAEMVSLCYVHCCLKGAHKAPVEGALWDKNIIPRPDFLVTPINIYGPPHISCETHRIPIIAVVDNKTIHAIRMARNTITVGTYLEAAGVVLAIKQGISLESIKRPLMKTKILNGTKNWGISNAQTDTWILSFVW
ncbi:MAG: DUF3326 domain-containing protein [Planctomycetes bacterium]|nr:DUF3326 domain-containing protein [Planctomycetota bacterium]